MEEVVMVSLLGRLDLSSARFIISSVKQEGEALSKEEIRLWAQLTFQKAISKLNKTLPGIMYYAE